MDKILEGFLNRQMEQSLELTTNSDVLNVFPLDAPPVQHYLLDFRCKGLVRTASGEVVEADRFHIGVRFPEDYLEGPPPSPFDILRVFAPDNIFHPQVHPRLPLVCIGHLTSAMSIVDIAYQLHEILTFNKVTMDENNALHPDACRWSRRNLSRFPVDRRPLKRRPLDLEVEAIEVNR